MYLKIEPEALEPTAKDEETQILDILETEDNLSDFSEKSGDDEQEFNCAKSVEHRLN